MPRPRAQGLFDHLNARRCFVAALAIVTTACSGGTPSSHPVAAAPSSHPAAAAGSIPPTSPASPNSIFLAYLRANAHGTFLSQGSDAALLGLGMGVCTKLEGGVTVPALEAEMAEDVRPVTFSGLDIDVVIHASITDLCPQAARATSTTLR